MAVKIGRAKRAPQTTPTHAATRLTRAKPARTTRSPRRHRPTLHRAPNFIAPLPAKRLSFIRQLPHQPGLVISLLLMLTGAAFLIYPFIPMVRYAIAKPAPEAPYETRLFDQGDAAGVTPTDSPTETVADGTAPAAPAGEVKALAKRNVVVRPKNRAVKPKPLDNRLVIPKIGVDVPIVEGEDQDTALMKGIWHIPGTSSPDKGSNTVLSGHRFRFLSGPRTLYLLDKLETGDPIIVYWKGKEYDYIVKGRKIVKPNQVEILDPTKKPRLTIFTCSPLFSTKERLVLFADLAT